LIVNKFLNLVLALLDEVILSLLIGLFPLIWLVFVLLLLLIVVLIVFELLLLLLVTSVQTALDKLRMRINVESLDLLLAAEELELEFAFLVVLVRVLVLHLPDLVVLAPGNCTRVLGLPVLIGTLELFVGLAVFASFLWLPLLVLLLLLLLFTFLLLGLLLFAFLLLLLLIVVFVPLARGLSHLHHCDVFILPHLLRDRDLRNVAGFPL